MSGIKSPKKLIEVALPLDDINAACAYEKMPGIGPHPRGIHLWWARRPLAAARAVLFAQMVNDPGGERGWQAGLTKSQAAAKRELLFDIIRDLVKWENINNEEVLERARIAIKQSWRETCAMNKGKPGFDPDVLPAFHDPFAGGGAIPLEAQRLGLESYASDLNPVAVMLNKAMIETPSLVNNSTTPIGPLPKLENNADLFKKTWTKTECLAEDVRRYGNWMLEKAKEKIGCFYPDVLVTSEMAKNRPDLTTYIGKRLKVIAWLWGRTVKSPNPIFSHVDVPLVSSFVLSNKKGKEAYISPVIDGDSYSFEVKFGPIPKGSENGTKVGERGSNFTCLMSQTPISADYIKQQGMENKVNRKLLAIVVSVRGGRTYLPPIAEHEMIANSVPESWKPEVEFFKDALGFAIGKYGLKTWADLFTKRQLLALSTFSELVKTVYNDVLQKKSESSSNDEAENYAKAISTYLAFVVDRCADFANMGNRWVASNQKIMNLFGKQVISMTWDFGEAAILEDTVGGFLPACEYVAECIKKLPKTTSTGHANQENAATGHTTCDKVVSTDPPYYDNIGYADLSDFFYVWLRHSIRDIYPDLFRTISTPKDEELVATPARHDGHLNAQKFFLDGMTQVMHHLATKANPAFPVTIYYAFKSSDTDETGTSNTGWETFLAAILKAGFAITGTWPMRSEQEFRMRGLGANALASSIVLVCRKRNENAIEIGRREFLSELRQIMPTALNDMMGKDGLSSPIAPVDLAQAAIGPGMEIFSKYKAVLNSDGTPMTVHEAMIEINRQITDYLNPDGSGFDPATLFCNDWSSSMVGMKDLSG